MSDLHYLDATTALRLFRSKELSPVELMRAVIDRHDDVGEPVNALTETMYEEALDSARDAEAQYQRGVEHPGLLGLPVATKEKHMLAGRRLSQGLVFRRDEVSDHTTTELTTAVTEPVDVLLNLAPIAPEAFAALVPLVRDGGAVVSTTAWMPTPGDESRGVRAFTVFVRSDAEQLARLVALVDRGELHVDVAERLPLAELPALHARAAAGELPGGKVIVVPAGA